MNNLRRADEFHMNLRNNEEIDIPFARLVSYERHPKLWLELRLEF